MIYGVLGTIEVLFLATFITLRSNFMNNAFTADLNVYNYTLQAESPDSNQSQRENFRKTAKEWLTASEHYRYAAESRTHSLNFSLYSLVFLLASLILASFPIETCWPVFFFVSIGFIIAAIVNFIFNRSAKREIFRCRIPKFKTLKCEITKRLYESSLKCSFLLSPEPERPGFLKYHPSLKAIKNRCKLCKRLLSLEVIRKCKLCKETHKKPQEVCILHEFRQRSRWPDIQELICNNDWLKNHLRWVQTQLDEGRQPRQDC